MSHKSGLLPEQANVCWYEMRMWIDGEFKLTKRSGWKWASYADE